MLCDADRHGVARTPDGAEDCVGRRRRLQLAGRAGLRWPTIPVPNTRTIPTATSGYDTIESRVQKRFGISKMFFQASVDYQWRDRTPAPLT